MYHGLSATDLHCPKQENTLEMGINIPTLCRIYIALFLMKGYSIALPSSFLMENLTHKNIFQSVGIPFFASLSTINF